MFKFFIKPALNRVENLFLFNVNTPANVKNMIIES
jgi:hypothetical protein